MKIFSELTFNDSVELNSNNVFVSPDKQKNEEPNLNFVSQDLVHALLYYNIQKAVKLSVKLKITVLSEQKSISDTDLL